MKQPVFGKPVPNLSLKEIVGDEKQAFDWAISEETKAKIKELDEFMALSAIRAQKIYMD